MRKGSKHKQSSKEKMAQAHIGKPLSKEHRLALIKSHINYRHSEETKHRIGLANAIPINKELLTKFYVQDKLSIDQVAQIMAVSAPTIHRNLKSLGIVRSPSEARRLLRPPRTVFYLERKMPNHPRANKRGYVKEHVLAWEQAHGQLLPEGWVIHHLNGLKNDNRPENLVGMPNGNHCSGLVNEALRKRILELETKLEEYANADNKSVRGECGGLVKWKEKGSQ